MHKEKYLCLSIPGDLTTSVTQGKRVLLSRKPVNGVTMQFKEWLKKEMQMKDNSIKVYLSHINRLERALNSTSFEDDEQVKGVILLHPKTRSAYRAYSRYMLELYEKQLPDLPVLPLGRPPKPVENIVDIPQVPVEVVDAIADCILSGLEAKSLKTRTWGHVIYNENKDRYETPEANGSKAWIILPKQAIQTLREWAQPTPEKEIYTPLVPTKPGSLKPVNLKWLLPLIEVRMSTRGKS